MVGRGVKRTAPEGRPPSPGAVPQVGARAAGSYGLLTAAASVLGLAKTVALAKILGANDLGYYGVVLIVLPFGTYLSTVGTLAALGVELPTAFGANDRNAEGLRDRALGLVVLATSVIGMIYLLIVASVPVSDPNMRTVLALGAFTVALNSLFEFYLTVLRATVRLVPLATAYLARSGLAFTGTLTAGALFGYRGAIVSEAIVLLVLVVYIARRLEPTVRIRLPRREESARLIRIGVPLSMANFALAVSLFADRTFVAVTLPDDLGQYTLAAVVTVAWLAAAGFVAQAVGASALHAYGSGLSLSGVRRRVGRASATALGAGALGLPVVIVLVDWLKDGAFSDYARGLDVVPILYAGGALSTVSIYAYVLLAARKFGLVLAATLAGLIVGLGGGIVIALGDPSIEEYAWTFFASQAVAAGVTIVGVELVHRSYRRLSAS